MFECMKSFHNCMIIKHCHRCMLNFHFVAKSLDFKIYLPQKYDCFLSHAANISCFSVHPLCNTNKKGIVSRPRHTSLVQYETGSIIISSKTNLQGEFFHGTIPLKNKLLPGSHVTLYKKAGLFLSKFYLKMLLIYRIKL